MSEAMKKVDNYKKDLMVDMLSQCTEAQQAMFHKMYPEGIEKMSDSKIANAFDQIERTIAKNNT